MADKSTPTKNTINKDLIGFSSVSLPQKLKPSQQNLTGLPRVTRDIAADVHNNVQKWNELHLKGAHLVKQIVQEKANNPGKYTPELEQHTKQLQEVVKEFCPYVQRFKMLAAQARAVGDLQRKHEAVLFSMDSQTMADLIEIITDFYIEEYSEKKNVLQNIAHAKNKDEAMFFASCWTLQCYVTNMCNEYLETLLSDVGLRTLEC